jgi:hypothetical protein
MAKINQYSILNPHINVTHLPGATDPVQNLNDSMNPFPKIMLARGPEEMY